MRAETRPVTINATYKHPITHQASLEKHYTAKLIHKKIHLRYQGYQGLD